MPKTVLFTFVDETQRDQFLAAIRKQDDPTTLAALETVRLDPPMRTDGERVAALFVAGSRIKEGPLPELEKLFAAELAAHRAPIELRELLNGEWVTIRRRAA